MRTSALRSALAVLSLLAAGCGQHAATPTDASGVAGGTPRATESSGSSQSVGATAAKLKVDQSNLVSDQLGLGNGLYGQTYVPGARNLTRVDVLLIVNQVPAGGVSATIGLFTSITQPPIATAAANIAAPAPGELRRTISFDFASPVPLTKGAGYTIGLYVPASASWEFAFGDPYPKGQVVLYDGSALNPTGDFVFTTYELK